MENIHCILISRKKEIIKYYIQFCPKWKSSKDLPQNHKVEDKITNGFCFFFSYLHFYVSFIIRLMIFKISNCITSIKNTCLCEQRLGISPKVNIVALEWSIGLFLSTFLQYYFYLKLKIKFYGAKIIDYRIFKMFNFFSYIFIQIFSKGQNL